MTSTTNDVMGGLQGLIRAARSEIKVKPAVRTRRIPRALLVISTVVGTLSLAGQEASAHAQLSFKVAPHKGVVDGETLNVSGRNWPGSQGLSIYECNANALEADEDACDWNNPVGTGTTFHGRFSGQIVFSTGTIGDGTCLSGQTCYILVQKGAPAPYAGPSAIEKVTVK